MLRETILPLLLGVAVGLALAWAYGLSGAVL